MSAKQHAKAIAYRSGLAYELWSLGWEKLSLRHLCRRIAWVSQRLIRPAVTINTELGNLRVSTRDSAIGRALYCNAEFEFQLLGQVRTLIDQLETPVQAQDGWLLDIGANIGVTAIPAINCGLAAYAICCEPDLLNFSFLTENIRLNGFADRIHAFNVAISDINGEATLELSRVNFGDHRLRSSEPLTAPKLDEDARAIKMVRAIAVDDVVAEIEATQAAKLRLAWIDTQGHEVHVLKGGERVFGSGLPTVIEVWPYGILRAGRTKAEFCHYVGKYWRSFIELGSSQADTKSIADVSCLWDALERTCGYKNVLLFR